MDIPLIGQIHEPLIIVTNFFETLNYAANFYIYCAVHKEIRQSFVDLCRAFIKLCYHQWLIPQCLKITEKVSFDIASEASYVYVLSGQKFIRNAQKRTNFSEFLKTEGCGQTVLPDKSFSIGQKLLENAKIQKPN